MNNFSRIAKNTFALTVSEIFIKAIGFVWVVFIAHSLSVFMYGRYNLVTAFISVFSILPDLGIGLIVIREIAKDRKMADLYLGNSLILTFFLLIVTFSLILISLFFTNYPQEVNYLILIAFFTLFLSSFRSVAVYYFDGTERMQYSGFLNSANSALLLIFSLAGLLLGLELKGIFYGMLTGTLISFILAWSLLIKKFVIPKIHFSSELIRHLFLEGLPLGLAALFYMVYTNIDSLMLSKMLGDYYVGIYNGARPFVFAIIELLNVPFIISVYPVLSRMHREDSVRFTKAIFKSLGFIFLWSFPVAILTYFLAPFMLPLIFGVKYISSIPVLRIFIFLVPFASLSALLYKVLIVLKKQYIYLFVSLFGVAVNILFNFILIPKLLTLGAALASVLTQITLFIVYMLIILGLLRRLRR